MDKVLTIRNILRLITVISWIVALAWFLNDRSYEPFLAFLAGTAALISSFFVPETRPGIRMKKIKAGRDVQTTDKTGNGIDMEDIEAGRDITTHEG
ncbi:MAG: hypothetical protein KDJ97_18960 [Anaerolineae bacterium]|nr:hypothetical protein [Anaerolineae bacterium]